ncbi:MAG TPA: hypothetical protein VG942_09265 [Hyphomonadaceae bacterium]|nr:hypothetical protein [Hyphomonadaceae bacterium]
MAARKQPAKPTSTRTKAKAPATAQSAAERKSAEAELDKLVLRFTPDQQRPVAAVRKALQKRLPTAHEIVYEYRDCFVVSYSPSERGYEGVLALRGSADGVRLYLTRGKELPDPGKLLRSAGGNTRWIDLESAATLARPEVVRLVDAAIALSPPFPSAGRGLVVLSPSTRKSR